MKIQLEKLQHQVDAIKAIKNSFFGIDYIKNDSYIYANPILKYRGNENAYIDIKMETGTGKTFVYTQMMYEMHKKGIFKFVIVVPTPSIKEGTKNFIDSDYAKQYFSSIPGYENVNIQLNEINAGDFRSKSGRKTFPSQLSNFIESTRQNRNQIQVLLINSGMLNSRSGMHKKDYDQTLLGGETNPIDAISSIRPIIIIDEPHRFPRNKTIYNSIVSMNPQLIVRFGATFPQKYIGRGKSKRLITDYYRGKPQFNLNAIDSFNQGLVKKIDINYPNISQKDSENVYKVKQVNSKNVILSQKRKEYVLNKNDSLSSIDPDFYGNIYYDEGKKLSNGLDLQKGMKLIPGTFSESYQDKIISEAINKHFENEEKNFMRNDCNDRAPKIKTLSLFFIDSIYSFRGDNNNGWLAKHFEKLLTEKLLNLIDKYKNKVGKRQLEYKDFLESTLKNLKLDNQQVYGGYFSEDRGRGDIAIQEEVDDILKNKDKMLTFKDEKGEWITRRFFFSKWTLREGWDNPNVFVIAKLRTSGSDISKIQEVGRGLRLPVDECGHRLTQDEYESTLSFLIGYDEKDFANELVSEVNNDSPVKINENILTNDMQNIIIEERKKIDSSFNKNKLLSSLDKKGIIDRANRFNNNVLINNKYMNGYEALCFFYPEIVNKNLVANDKIYDGKLKNLKNIKLRKNNWNELKKLWGQLSNRYMIKFDNSVDYIALKIAKKVFSNLDLFVIDKSQITEENISLYNEEANINKSIRDMNYSYSTMNYGEFIKSFVLSTDLPASTVNNLLINSMKNLKNNIKYINEKTLNNLIQNFNSILNSQIEALYDYIPLNFSSKTSVYNNHKNDFVDYISPNSVGNFSSYNINDDKRYLYDLPPLRYDSANPELEILQRNYSDKITVFGKLPKSSVKIPRYDGGTSTPDFIFKINNGNKYSYIIIETKAENMRINDRRIKFIQEKYFNKLEKSGVYYKLATSANEVNDFINKYE